MKWVRRITTYVRHLKMILRLGASGTRGTLYDVKERCIMFENTVISIIKKKFEVEGNPTRVPLLLGHKSFEAKLSKEGIYVDNLGSSPFLPWQIFIETVRLLQEKGGRAKKGNAMNYKLGESGLPIDSVEGNIAIKVYSKQIGESVFRRITPVACILIWAGICRHEPNQLILKENTVIEEKE